MTDDHCPACRIVRELEEHREAAYPEWSIRRACLNFAVIIARRECPEYQPTTSEGDA